MADAPTTQEPSVLLQLLAAVDAMYKRCHGETAFRLSGQPGAYRSTQASSSINLSRTWLWQLLDGSTNAGRRKVMAMIRKRQLQNIAGNDSKAQAAFIAAVSEVSA